MTQEGKNKVKTKLQELLAVVKEEAVEESKETREDIMKAITEIRQTLEEKWQDTNFNEIVNDLEGKALKAKYTIQEKLGESKEKKDEVVAKTADSLVDAVNKVKGSLLSKK